MKVDATNALAGDLKGYDCKQCNNKGYIAFLKDGHEYSRICNCMEIRRSLKLIKESGLGRVIEKYSFENYIAEEEWQKYIKERAIDYVDEEEGWFYIGGQVGCGKSHICTAIVKSLLEKGVPVKYMLWKDESARLKANVNDSTEYEKMMKLLKEAELLYIDDFLKTGYVTAGDINLAFEIINYRYNENLKTVISSEKSIADLLSIDEAIGSRIKEMSRGYTLEVGTDKRKNYRLK